MKQKNISIETIFVAVDCKTRECLSFIYKFPREENQKQQCLMKIKRRNIQSIQYVRMRQTYYHGLNSTWEKIRFQLALNKTFFPTPKPSATNNLNTTKKKKINQENAFCLPLIDFPYTVHSI